MYSHGTIVTNEVNKLACHISFGLQCWPFCLPLDNNLISLLILYLNIFSIILLQLPLYTLSWIASVLSCVWVTDHVADRWAVLCGRSECSLPS